MQNLPRLISHIPKKTLVPQYPLGCHSLPHQNFPFSRSLSMCVINGPSTLAARAMDSVPGHFLKWAALGFSRGSRFATGFTPLQRKPLDSIIDIEMAKFQSPDDLISAWEDYHLGRGHIGTAITAQLYRALDQRSISCRHFVIPLSRGSGYTTMFIQVQMPSMLFTGLEDYKTRGTQATPYFTITHYTEFAESKGIVLVRGEVVLPSKLDDSEARRLLETAQSFYLNDAKYKLVERFNKEAHEFEFNDVLRALEMPLL
ncbi:ATP synthase mitochondrial F1 complex assembly factor 1 [Phalaenopsis equestris]|uniref:ATP synthase mitochondrial F1 complex assembly factor 1 n=1 Tax=Phalaenopsis equestris TaxID=78828 RepID=UPI0009E4E249|nr:ATP synthase mitochondrial F1 complex assembly factor 1 [Phalaenopsis equestris]